MRTLKIMFFAIVCAAWLEAAAPESVSREFIPSEVPGIDLPVTREHTYKMSGRVRALLLWVGRDDVGSGVIRWRGTGDDHAYELLIGSDPVRAPGKLNKWGYLAEELRGGECDVVGVISKDAERRLSDVKAGLANAQGERPFDTIRGRVTERQAYAQVATLQASNSLTYRDADAVLKLALDDESSATRKVDRPRGVRPGFLGSVAELIRVTAWRQQHDQPLISQSLTYVYGDGIYDLRLTDAVAISTFERDGRVFHDVIRGRFETGRLGSYPGSRFELIFGTIGPLAEIPILISYQPKWWLHVELTLRS